MTTPPRWTKWYYSNLKKHRADERARYRRRVKEGNERERSRIKTAKARVIVKAFIKQAKEIPCADCGKRYPYYVMDFDHIRGRKEFTINTGSWGRNIGRVKSEVAKCEVVCSNCHRERTYQRQRAVQILGCNHDYFKFEETMPI